jgi:hypothetical protein
LWINGLVLSAFSSAISFESNNPNAQPERWASGLLETPSKDSGQQYFYTALTFFLHRRGILVPSGIFRRFARNQHEEYRYGKDHRY